MNQIADRCIYCCFGSNPCRTCCLRVYKYSLLTIDQLNKELAAANKVIRLADDLGMCIPCANGATIFSWEELNQRAHDLLAAINEWEEITGNSIS